MSQLTVQIVFVAIFVLVAFDDGPKSGPVKIRKVADATFADIKYWTLHMHDYYRSMVARGLYPNKNGTMLPTASQMYSLAWDDKLYNYALNWSKQCKFEHTNGPYGENLWMITSSNLNDITAIQWAVGSWMKEINKECGLLSTTFDNSINWECVGHAMQILWSSWGQHTVGCAVNHCPWTYVVCSYGTGNIWTKAIYYRGPPCKTGTDCGTRFGPATCKADLGLCLVQGQSTSSMPNSTVRYS